MESANGQSTGLGGVGWGADALSEAPGHLAKPTSPFLGRSLLSSTLAPGTRPPSPPSDSHPPGGCQLTPLLSDWGAFKAQLDPAIPPHTRTHCVHLLHFKSRAPSTPNWCTVGLKLFPGPGLGDLLSEVPDSWEGSVPSRCPALGPATGRGGVRPAPPARGRPSSGAPAAPPSAWAALCSPWDGAQLSLVLGHTKPLFGPLQAGWHLDQEERLPLGQRSDPSSQRGVGGVGRTVQQPPPPGRLEDPGQENEVG